MAEMRATILTLAAWLGMSLQALAAPPPTVTNATDGILTAFRAHPVVGLGEVHNWAQELDFYTVLLRDPRSALCARSEEYRVGGRGLGAARNRGPLCQRRERPLRRIKESME